jgi:hypothetical protein
VWQVIEIRPQRRLSVINHRLWQELDKVAARDRRLRFWSALAAAWLIGAMVGLALWASGLAPAGNSRVAVPLLCGVGLVLAGACLWLARASAPGYLALARRIESEFPELHSCLLAALEQQPSLHTGRFGFLQESVIGQALIHADRHPWRDVVPARRMALAVSAQFMTLSLFLFSLVAAAFWVTPATISAAAKEKRHGNQSGEAMSFIVEPGNTEIERGSSLLVLARVTGPLPAEAALVFEAAGEGTRSAMSASLDDPVFGARVPAVNEPLDYHVELDGKSSPIYHVAVFEYPRLERADARLVYPKYTALEERLVQDFRTVSVVEGTDITIICHLNKRVASAVFTEKVGKERGGQEPGSDPLLLAPTDAEHADYQATFRAEHSRRLKLELVDDAGRANLVKSELSIQVVANKPPTIKPVFPARDFEVSPLEELDLKATVWDDFGVARFGVSYATAGAPPVDLVLGEKAAARQKHELATRIDFEKLAAEPDQLLSYYFWAEDFDGRGELRRTSGDMYFAEVRQFDEIFRQGQALSREEQQRQQQQQQQQGGQNAQAAQQLAQLQKDITNATWKLIRREIGAKPTDGFAADAKEVAQSQATAREQAEKLSENVRDSQSLEHLNAVFEAMDRAIAQLEAAQTEPSAKPLQPALAAEQSAYQGLLKLRAREHEVVRQQRQQQSRSAQANSARSQQQRQQLNQLELSKEENRYETQREARSQPEEQADREARQVLNRLRELARRQHDLNERLKDLQSALQEAQTPEKKEEIRRQLKRLEEEQSQMLRDTDELATRMDAPENQERMSDERQQLEQTREQVRRTSESLEKEQVTQAAASGTRAEREFEELRNEFRRRASGRFNEQMRDMRDAARELDRREKEIGQKLAAPEGSDSSKKSLRDEDNRQADVPREIAEQRQRLTKLTEQMRETIQEAEQTEPLLSERLYEAARNAQDQNVDRALDATNRSLRQGLQDDARQLERAASKGIEKLREGVERAAEAVLGDETEALRRAREELQDLSRELNQEISRNAPEGQQPRSPRANSSTAQRNRSETGEPGEGDPQAERDSQGEPRDGQQQSEEGQQGEGQRGQPREGQGARNNRGQRGPSGQQPSARQPGQGRSGENQSEEDQAGEPQEGGQQPSDQPGGEQPGERQPGEQQSGRQQSGQQQQQGRGQRQGGQQRGQQRGGQQAGGQQPGQAQDGQPQPGDPQEPGREPRDGQRGGQRDQGGNRGGPRRLDNQAGPGNGPPEEGRNFAPIAGGDFLNWSDRLRDVEEMVDDPELRAEAARIRDRARSIRAELKRHSKTPNWDLVRMQVAEPLVELTDRVAEEVLRRNSKQAIVPLDRDPVPPKYSEKTRKYYEQLGTGK